MSKKNLISLLIAASVCLVAVIGYELGYFYKPELYVYDAEARLFRSTKHWDKRVKVILVDEAALKSMSETVGRWPWPRATWSDLLDYLAIGGARAVLFDVLFLERQNSENDSALINATREFQRAFHSMIILRNDADKQSPGRSLPQDVISRFALKNVRGNMVISPDYVSNDYSLPISGLSEAAKGIGVVEFAPDSDGGYRRTKPLREYQGSYFPVLGLVPFVDSNTPVVFDKGLIRINDRDIPIDSSGNCIINMYAPSKVEAYSMSSVFASLQQIRKGDVENIVLNPNLFKDSIVFIGASAIGTADLKTIPMERSAPGVLLHAFMANSYLQNDFMAPPSRTVTLASIFMGAFITVWAIVFSRVFWLRAIIPASVAVAYISFALTSFNLNAQVEMVPFLFTALASGFLAFIYLTFTEGADKRKVSHLFAQYVSQDVLDVVMHDYEEYAKTGAGQKVEITVLFSDIRGFTTMSETTAPEDIVEMLNVHFTVMADIILKHNGTIDKYIGDAIMAFWGAPVKTSNHAEQAVRAGQEMLLGLQEVNRMLKERGFDHEIKIGIGINTGVATIGSIGSEIKKNFTVVGDTVNLSSRLESITKEQKVPLIFSEYTYEKIKERIDCKLIGTVTVKGREQSVDIYTTVDIPIGGE